MIQATTTLTRAALQLTFAHAGLGVFFRPSGIALTFSREIPNGWSNRPLPDGRVVS